MPIAQSIFAAGRGNAWTPPPPVGGGEVDDAPTTNQKYVRQGASGSASGNDWTNAYTSLPATLARDTTYWIADGTYGSYDFNDATSGAQVIRIKKATDAFHGTGTGWNSTYGDGEAVFYSAGAGTLSFSTGYYTFDGSVGSGASGYGFRVYCGDTTGSDLISIANVSNIIIKFTDASQFVYGGAEGNLNDVIYAVSGGNHLLIKNCYLHDTNWYATLKMIGWSNVTVDGCYFARCFRKEIGRLSDMINLVWSNNFHKEAAGTGYLVLDNVDGCEIYNNVFVVTDSSYTTTDSVISNLYSQGFDANNVKIHHNTFVGCRGETRVGFDSGTNIVAYNNLFYNCQNVGWYGSITHDYNWAYPSTSAVSGEANGQIGLGDPFVNAAADDYRLASGTTNGTPLSSPFNVDKDGVTRAGFDRGAYEKL